eukprot:gene3588-3854_t
MPATLVCCNLALAGRSYTIGTGGGGQSQQISKEIQAQLPSYEPVLQEPVSLTHKRGKELLNDPWFNKGTGFSKSERERLQIRGLLPPRISSMKVQAERFMNEYLHGVTMIPPEEIETGGVTTEMARRWQLLSLLHSRNETLFYRILIDNFEDMAAVVYTPTVGWVCSNYHKLYKRPRGMYFSAKDKGEMAAMVWSWPQSDVHAIVVTDGSRILGLGDLGLNGLGIPVGKLDLYCAAAGFHPSKVLPCVIDVGTNNVKLREEPLYMGLQMSRLTGPAYYDILDEFVTAVMARWPNAVLQFEDFEMQHALTLLERYRKHHLVFNDDIQGTAATALAGVYGALRVLGCRSAEIAKQRIVCVGAGSAGMGVVKMVAAGMERVGGLTPEQAASNFWLLDAEGLITRSRPGVPDYVERFARPAGSVDVEGEGLLQVVQRVKPTILMGLAGAGRLFTDEVLAAVATGCDRPVVMPMSNPISEMECTAEAAMAATQGRCVFASGSPQPPVTLNGEQRLMSQANNMYVFPGVALGAFLGSTGIVTDGMMMAAAETLPDLISDADVQQGLYWFLILGPILLFTILVHELGHCLAARQVGGEAHSILLWPLGGLAFIGHDKGPKADIWVAVAGPLTHVPMTIFWLLMLLLATWVAYRTTHITLLWPNPLTTETLGIAICVGAVVLNITVFAFNLLVPAYPLDGGRILVDSLLTCGVADTTACKITIAVAAPIAVGIIVLGAIWLQVVTILAASVSRVKTQGDRTSFAGLFDAGKLLDLLVVNPVLGAVNSDSSSTSDLSTMLPTSPEDGGLAGYSPFMGVPWGNTVNCVSEPLASSPLDLPGSPMSPGVMFNPSPSGLGAQGSPADLSHLDAAQLLGAQGGMCGMAGRPKFKPRKNSEPKIGPDGQPRLNARQRRTLRRAKERALKGLLEVSQALLQKAEVQVTVPNISHLTALEELAAVEAEKELAASSGGMGDVDGHLLSHCGTSATGKVGGAAGNGRPAGVTRSQQLAAAAAAVEESVCEIARAAVAAVTAQATGKDTSSAAAAAQAAAAQAASAAASAGAVLPPGFVLPEAEEPTSEDLPACTSDPPPGSVHPTNSSPLCSPLQSPTPAISSGPAGAGKAAGSQLEGIDIAGLIGQLSLKKDEGMVDDKLIRDLQIIQSLIGALKAPSASGGLEGPNGGATIAQVAACTSPSPACGSTGTRSSTRSAAGSRTMAKRSSSYSPSSAAALNAVLPL